MIDGLIEETSTTSCVQTTKQAACKAGADIKRAVLLHTLAEGCSLGSPSSRKPTSAVTGRVAQWQVSHRVKGSRVSLGTGRAGGGWGVGQAREGEGSRHRRHSMSGR